MTRYRLFDFILESDVELPELETVRGGAPELRVSRDDHPERAAKAQSFHTFNAGQEPWLDVGRTDDGFVLKFGDALVLRYLSSEVRWHGAPGLEHPTFRHILLDQALPLIAAHEGRLVLHAACVWRGATAMLFVGPAGSGKSTLAASLVSDGQSSAADDAVAVASIGSGMIVRPAYGGLRLWPDASDALGCHGGDTVSVISEKRRFPASRASDRDLSLAAVYVLAPAAPAAGSPAVRPLSRRQALISLVRNSFVLDVDDRGRAAAHFESLAALVRRVPVHKLVVPRRFEALGAVRDLLERDLPLGALA